jgi:hypothetical protein
MVASSVSRHMTIRLSWDALRIATKFVFLAHKVCKMLVIYLYTKCYVSNSNSVLIVALKLKATYKFRRAVILF